MKLRILGVFTISLALAGFASFARAGETTYLSPDHRLRAIVIGVDPKKEGSDKDAESRVEIRTATGKLLLSRDYSSPDGEHGDGVIEAQWTPDSAFFVYSMSSSGGHQPYYYPTLAYSAHGNTVRRLNYTTVTGNFKIIAPHSLRTLIWPRDKDGAAIMQEVGVTMDLESGAVEIGSTPLPTPSAPH